ncbi:MAG: hypothetical protein J0M00_15305 [Burkholderiales bacterium]|nr:hypothetical protein [Burkholderiales bacterium]
MSTEASGREGGWGALPAPALLALRAAAVLGERFSLEALASLTEQSPLRALEALQLAVDAGVPLTERDDGATGEFALPEALVRSLRNGTLPALARRHPDLLVQLIEADAPQLDQLVAREEIDVALCRTPAQIPQGWSFEPLLPDRFIVVAGPDHPLCKRRRLTVEQLRGHAWLAMPAGSAARAMFDALFADGAAPPLCQISCRIPTLLRAMLRAQPLLALIPASVVRPLIADGDLAQLPFEHRLEMDPIGALYRQGDERAGVLRFMQALKPA